MDLNYLLQRHQVSLIRAEAATCIEARRSHEMLALRYARQIDAFRRTRTPRRSAALRKSAALNAA
jgi:hypothetical protein